MDSLGRAKHKKAQRYWRYVAQARFYLLERDPLVVFWLFANLGSFGEC